MGEQKIKKNENTYIKLNKEQSELLTLLKKKSGYENRNNNDIFLEAVNQILEQKVDLNFEASKDDKKKRHQIKASINLSEVELKNLEKLKEAHGFSTLNKELRFLLMPSLNGKDYYNNEDMKVFREVNVSLNVIANNINQIAKVLNSNKGNIATISQGNLVKSFEYLEKNLPILHKYIKATQELIRKSISNYNDEILKS